MQDFEKLGAFYLGRPAEPGSASKDAVLLYDSSDLVTHAMIIGMTGSGKTGLGIAMIEEAALDGIPALAIDPKGDLANLLLTFPDLAPSDFRPWINEDEARRSNVSPDEFAAQQAALWKKGLASWGEDGARIAKLRAAADMAIYTPGSSAGIGIYILRSFAAPPPEVRNDAELLGDRIQTSVTGLLTLVGIDADPVKSREHILLSTVVSAAWAAGEDLDLGALIQRIQSPPVKRIGVLDLDAFYPAAQRFDLAMRLNGLLAAPGFASWLEGQPLDVDAMLHGANGKPRVAVVSIAHLGDAERMFFVSLLFNQVLGWIRRQTGTNSLRAVLYMDEVAGYMPPVANPPSKPPLLTLLKQARAFGLGVVLSTQNPGDLDYKGLSNLGTWMIGRLQTERDKSKVLDGLEGALAGSGPFDRQAIDRMLSGLGKRVFLLHNVHEGGPALFETRWTMSYLRGPLTKDQIRRLMKGRTETAPQADAAAITPSATAAAAAPTAATRREKTGASAGRPVLPPDVPQFFAPSQRMSGVHYAPRLFASAQVQFTDTKLNVDETRDVAVLVPLADGSVTANWDAAEDSPVGVADLETEPAAGATFDALPSCAGNAKSYAAWQKEFVRWVSLSKPISLFRDPKTGITSKPGESERDFRVRLRLAGREQRDAEKERLRQKYAPRVAALQERERRAAAAQEREQAQASQQKLQAAITVGGSLLGALFGRKTLSASTIGRAATAAKGMGRVLKESGDVARAGDTVEAVRQQRTDLEAELASELAAVDAGPDADTTPLDTLSLKPKRTGIAVQRVALAWVPDTAEG